jgi:hypothetical protein
MNGDHSFGLSVGNYHPQDAISKLRYDAKPMLQFGIIFVRFDALRATDHIFHPSSLKLTFCYPPKRVIGENQLHLSFITSERIAYRQCVKNNQPTLVSENGGGLFKTDPVCGQIPSRLVSVPLKSQTYRIGGTVMLNVMPLKGRRL